MRGHRVDGRREEPVALRRSASAGARPADAAGPLLPASVLALQRVVGNAAVTRLVAQRRVQQQEEAQAHVQRRAVDTVLRSGGKPLDDDDRSDLESRLGSDFSDVRIHTDSAAHAAAESVRAQAFTSGSHVVFGRGNYDPASTAGKRMLAHELTHVVQQRSGPVPGTDRGDGLHVSDPSDAFEQEAEATAVRAMSGPPREVVPVAAAPGAAAGTPVQRVADNLPGFGEDDYDIVDAVLSDDTRAPAGWRSTITATPEADVRYSGDGSLAIRSDTPVPKEFYAHPELLTRANKELDLADARLVLEAGSHQLPPGPNSARRRQLVVARPRSKDAPHDPDRYADLVNDECVELAAHILRPLTHLVFRGQGGHTATEEYRGYDEVRAKAAGVVDGLRLMEPGDHPAMAAEAAQEGPRNEKPGDWYGYRRFSDELMRLAQDIGINAHALAHVGEAYTSQSTDAGPGRRPGTHKHWNRTDSGAMEAEDVSLQWPFHFAAVVADSFDRHDQITLENFTRKMTVQRRNQQLVAWMRQQFPKEMEQHTREARRLLMQAHPNHQEMREGREIPQLIGRMRASYQGFRNQSLEEAGRHFARMEAENEMEASRMWYFRMVAPGTQTALFHYDTGEKNPLTMVAAFLPEAVRLEFNRVTNRLNDSSRTVLDKFAKRVVGLRDRKLVPVIHLTANAGHDLPGTSGRVDDRMKTVSDYLKSATGGCDIERKRGAGSGTGMTLSLTLKPYDQDSYAAWATNQR